MFSLDMETRLVFITRKMAFVLQNLLAISVTVEDTSNSFVLITYAMDGKESIPPGMNFGLVYTCSQLHE